MPILDHSTVLGDILIFEAHDEYSRESVVVTNPEANANTFGIGYPLAAGVPLLNAAIGTMDGILLERFIAGASEAKKCAVLRRGPAVVNVTRLPTADYNGTTFTLATIKTQLLAMDPPVVWRAEPTGVEETEI